MRESRAISGTIRGAITALAFSILILALPSFADAGWNAPQVVSGVGSSTSQTRIAGGTDGSAWVIWKRNVAGFDVIQGTKVAADGTQGAIVTISGAAANATDPVITARADGSAMVGWLNTSATDDAVETATITADGTIGSPVTRSTPGPVGQPAADISIALGVDGTAGVAWRKYDGANWVVQGVRIASDGTSGTIHDLSDAAVTSGPPDMGAAPPPSTAPSTPVDYRAVWPGGTGADANVYSRQINADDTTTELFKALYPVSEGGIGTGGDPHNVQIAYEPDGSINVMWVRLREDFTTDDPPVPYYNDAVEWIRAGVAFPGNIPTLDPSIPPLITTATPIDPLVHYNVTLFTLDQPFGVRPVMSWVHALNGGGYHLVTAQIIRNGQLQGWADPAGDFVTEPTQPVIAANNGGVGTLGWGIESPTPGEFNTQWSRFSNTSFNQSFLAPDAFSEDVGFAIGNSGDTMAAYTGITAGLIGSSKVSTFTQPGLVVNPPQFNYGNVRIGIGSTRYVSIRSNGETANEVSGIALSGADASQFTLQGASDCLRDLGSGTTCTFGVKFTPNSTGAKNATVTVTSEAGNAATTLVGNGLDQTTNNLTAKPANQAARKGKVVRVNVKASNNGGTASKSTKVCVNYRKRAIKLSGNRCRSLGSLPAGASRNLTFRFRVTWRAPKGTKLPTIFRMNSANAVVRQAVVNIRRKGN